MERLYARYGARAANRVAGPVSWVLWDAETQRLVAAGDRQGLHPIYYSRSPDGWCVADRVEPLLEKSSGARPNRRALLMYVNALGPLPGETYYEGIEQVVPGHVATFTRAGRRIARYWSADAVAPLRLGSDEEYSEALRSILNEVVAEYLPEAGPVAFTLSSGMDSTSVAAAARSAAPDRSMGAVTWTLPDLPSADETPLSDLVAERLRIDRVECLASEHWPLSHPDGIRTERVSPWCIMYRETFCRMCVLLQQSGYSTLLSGLDGDRLFSIVSSYPDLFVTGRWIRLACEVRRQMINSGRVLATLRSAAKILIRDVVRTYRPRWRLDRPTPWSPAGSSRELRACMRVLSFPERGLPGRRIRIRRSRDPELGLTVSYMGRLAAEHGVDFRHPLLDHRLFEFAVSLPATQGSRAGAPKFVVRNAMRNRLPPEVVELRSKTYTLDAFVHRGLRERETQKIWPLLRGMRTADMGLVDEARVQAHFRAYIEGDTTDAYLLWYAFTAEDWLRRHF